VSHARTASDEGVAILFDGQKQYPAATVTVDFTFVDHLEHDCIEIIGICIPFETRIARAELGRNQSAGVAVKAEISAALQRLNLSHSDTETPTPAPTAASSSALLGASAATTGLYSMTYEERQSLPVIRVLISAKSFYEKIIANKKLKDKKNRRAEQTMVINSKMTQNMAAQSLLGGISVCLNPAFKSSVNSNTAAIPNTTSTSTSERERERERGGITGTPYLLKIFLSDITIEYKDISDMKSTFTSHSPYDKLEKGSRRNVESLKRRISYNSLDTGPDPDLDIDIDPDPDPLSDSVHLTNKEKDKDEDNNVDSNHDDINNDDNDNVDDGDGDENTNYNGESEKDSKGAFEDYYENVFGSERRDEEEVIEEVEEEVIKEAEVEVVKEVEEVVEEDFPKRLADGVDDTATVEPVVFVIETELETVMEIELEIENEV
jgi:hypothetical protein